MTARTVVERPERVAASAHVATCAVTSVSDQKRTRSTKPGSSRTPEPTRRSAPDGFAPIASGSVGTTPTSPPSGQPSNGSNKQWRKPRDAKSFAAQANEVATMILNGEMELDTARVYSGVARTMAQVLSAEVYRARFLQQEPNLSLEDES